ncbi:hypothetical protein HY409_01745 [Candidatus Gottesmanbacteria bacterium]|nr:hypothetical protein [Candidatus Gottesmanbacteria bacterium]
MERVFAGVDLKTDLSKTLYSFGTFGDLVSVIVKNAFVIASVIAFIFLVFGGFSIIMGAGGGDTKKIEQGKEAMTGAVIGLLIVIGSLWIVQIIEKLTGLSLLTPK